MGESYYLKPDKIRGLSLTSYNFLTTFVWSYLIFLSIIGIYIYIKSSTSYLDYIKLSNNFLLTGFLILILGYIGSSMPFVNFMNYYYFGQNKYGTDNQNLFEKNFWGESVAWRGFYPSAETIGEFFAISILLFFIIRIKKYPIKLMFIISSFQFLYLDCIFLTIKQQHYY